MTEAELIKRLATKYSQPEWAFIPHVRSSTGGAERTADGLAMHMYRSRGHEVCGFEIKVSRSDWLSELKNAAKAERIMQYCDRWYVVAAKGVVKNDLPLEWGLLEPHGAGLRIIHQAEVTKSDAMDRPFIAALLRKVSEGSVPYESIKSEVEQARAEGKQSALNNLDWESKHAISETKNLREMMDKFEAVIGVKFDTWAGIKRMGKVAKHVKIAMALDEIRNDWQIEGAMKLLRKALKELKKISDE